MKREVIEKALEEKKVKFNGAMFFEISEDDSMVTIYDMNYTTFKRTKVAKYLVIFNKLVLL